MALITDYIRSLIPVNWRTSPSGWTSGNCPMCVTNGQTRPDTKGRGGFYIDGEEITYNCFNCGYKAGWSPGIKVNHKLKKLLKAFGADESDVNRLQLELMKEDQLGELLAKRTEEKTNHVYINWKEIELPAGSQSIAIYSGEATNDFISAVQYIHDRGFDPASGDFYYSPSNVPGRMKKRFIVPFFYKQQVVGFAARWIGNPPEGMTKYYRQNPPHNFVYGLDKQKDKRIIIVTEGELDAIVTDGVAIGSNNCNPDQADVINSLKARVILLPDADKSSMRLVNQALDYGWEVSFPDWQGCKDAGDAVQKYGRLATVRSILESAEQGSTKIRILAKSYCK